MVLEFENLKQCFVMLGSSNAYNKMRVFSFIEPIWYNVGVMIA